jgi:SAM-dependent methyltransferase
MSTQPDTWVYGDFMPDPEGRDLPGLKARWLRERLPAEAAPRVLDYGAGEGKYLQLVRRIKPAASLVGVDIRAPHTLPDFEFHTLEPGANLPFASNSFDVVISFDVLEHVEQLDQSLQEIHRILRSGGSFVGFVPTEGGLGAHAFFRCFAPHIYRDTKDHSHAYTRRELLGRFMTRFRIVGLSYSYHVLGGTADAVFFAAFKLPILGRRLEAFWRGQDNDVYRARAHAGSRRSVASRLIRVVNRAAYYESTVLRNVPFGAKGLHFHLEKS